MLPDAPLALSVAFAGLALAVAALFVAGTAVAARRLCEPGAPAGRVALGTAAWMAVTGGAAASGALARFDLRPPPLLFVLAGSIALALAVGRSRLGARLARGLPLAALVGVQAFRFPLELAMHGAARAGVMPARMTFTGTNFDILTGLLAIPLAIALARGAQIRSLVRAWNILGALLLANVVGTAILSTPAIHAFGTAPADLATFIAYLPFVWLPAVLVAAAATGHIVVARALRA